MTDSRPLSVRFANACRAALSEDELRAAFEKFAADCFGELPTPEPHGDGLNTHRMCMRGAKDDGEWTFDVQINKGDAWHFYRLIRGVFGFGYGTLGTSEAPND